MSATSATSATSTSSSISLRPRDQQDDKGKTDISQSRTKEHETDDSQRAELATAAKDSQHLGKANSVDVAKALSESEDPVANRESISTLQKDLKDMAAQLKTLMEQHNAVLEKNEKLEAKLTPMMESFNKAFPHYDTFQGLFGKGASPGMYSSIFGNNAAGSGANSMFSSKWTAGWFGLGAVSILGSLGLGAAMIFGM